MVNRNQPPMAVPQEEPLLCPAMGHPPMIDEPLEVIEVVREPVAMAPPAFGSAVSSTVEAKDSDSVRNPRIDHRLVTTDVLGVPVHQRDPRLGVLRQVRLPEQAQAGFFLQKNFLMLRHRSRGAYRSAGSPGRSFS